MKLINEKQNVKGVSMQRFLQWYHKSTRNKVIIFSIIFTLALGYSFLHRPLGLIMWYHLNFIEEKEQVETTRIHIDNKEKFLDLYRQYDITHNFRKSQKELFKYIDDFEIDLLASSFMGLSEWYLQSFLSKSRIYVEYFNIYIGYQEYHENTYTPENTNMFMEFLDKNQKISFFIDRLALKDEDFERYMFQQNAILIMFIFPYIYFLSGEQVCALPNKEKISNVLMQFFDVYQKLQGENKTYKIGKERQGDTFDKNLQGLLNLHNLIKDKLNECQ